MPTSALTNTCRDCGAPIMHRAVWCKECHAKQQAKLRAAPPSESHPANVPAWLRVEGIEWTP